MGSTSSSSSGSAGHGMPNTASMPPTPPSSASPASARRMRPASPGLDQGGFVVPAPQRPGARRKGKRAPRDPTLTVEQRLAQALAEQELNGGGGAAHTVATQTSGAPGSLVDMANRMHLVDGELMRPQHRLKPRAPSSAPSSLARRSESDGLSSGRSSTSSGRSSSGGSVMAREPVSLRDFDTLKMLGKGSHGKVFLVRHKATKELYAMKELRKTEVLRKKQEHNTRRELHANALLQREDSPCPFVVPLRFAFHSRSRLYMVFDFLSGGELYTHLVIRGRLPEELARFYAAEMALALAALHAKGVMYRDLKPENLLLDAEGHIHLADLGLCQDGICSATKGSTTYVGTCEYLAPEILSCKEHGFAVDFWALGMVVFELLTGLPPFYSYNQQEVVHGILHGDLVYPAHMSPAAKDLVQQLLQRDPAQRLGSRAGVEELMAHPFLAGTDWAALGERRVTPPFRPPADDAVCNFDPEFTSQTLDAEPDYLQPRSDDVFDGFYYDPEDPVADGAGMLRASPDPLA